MRSSLERFGIYEKRRLYIKKLFISGLLAGFLFGMIGFEPGGVNNNLMGAALDAIAIITLFLIGFWILFPCLRFFKSLIYSKESKLKISIGALYGLGFSVTPIVLALYQYNSYGIGFGGPPPLPGLLTAYIGVSSVVGVLILGIIYYFKRDQFLLNSNIHLVYAAIFVTGFFVSGFVIGSADLDLIDKDKVSSMSSCGGIIKTQCQVSGNTIDLPERCLNQEGELKYYLKDLFNKSEIEDGKISCNSFR